MLAKSLFTIHTTTTLHRNAIAFPLHVQWCSNDFVVGRRGDVAHFEHALLIVKNNMIYDW